MPQGLFDHAPRGYEASPPPLFQDEMRSLMRARFTAWVLPLRDARDAAAVPRSVALAWWDGDSMHSVLTRANQPILAHVLEARPDLICAVPRGTDHHILARRLGWNLPKSTYCLRTMEAWMHVRDPHTPRLAGVRADHARDVLRRFGKARNWFLETAQVTPLQTEMQFVPCAARMADRPLHLDTEAARATLTRWLEMRRQCTEAFPHINLAHPQAVRRALDEIGLDWVSMDARSLRFVADGGGTGAALAAACLEHGRASAIARAAEEFLVHADDRGELRAHWQSHGELDGGVRSVLPDLQAAARHGELRGLFRAAPERALVSVEFANQDLRALAYLSGDAGLAQDLSVPGRDVMDIVRRNLAVPSRRIAEVVLEGVALGYSAERIAQTGSLHLTSATSLVRAFREAYPDVYDHVQRQRINGDRHIKDVITGKSIPLDSRLSPDVRERYARVGPVRMIGALQVKTAMVAAEAALARAGGGVVMALPEGLLCEMPRDGLSEALPDLMCDLEDALPLGRGRGSIPMFCRMRAGSTWALQEEVPNLRPETDTRYALSAM